MQAAKFSQRSPWSLIICLAFTQLPANALAASTLGVTIAEHGINDVPACALCHGEHGEGDRAAGYPRLAGMNAGYLLNQLDHYADGSRRSQVMQVYSRALTRIQRRAIAEYYAAKPGLGSQLHTGRQANNTIAALVNKGDWSRNIPACFSCHGKMGTGSKLIPAIADQPVHYFIVQMNHWRTGTRPVGEGDPMATIAKNLTPTEIAGIARYLANESPRK